MLLLLEKLESFPEDGERLDTSSLDTSLVSVPSELVNDDISDDAGLELESLFTKMTGGMLI